MKKSKKHMKKVLQKAAILGLSVCAAVPGFTVRAESETEKPTWPVIISGNELTVDYDGEAHTVSGFQAGTMPENTEAVYVGETEPVIAETETGEYTLDPDPEDFQIQGDYSESYLYEITTSPLKLTINAAEEDQVNEEDYPEETGFDSENVPEQDSSSEGDVADPVSEKDLKTKESGTNIAVEEVKEQETAGLLATPATTVTAADDIQDTTWQEEWNSSTDKSGNCNPAPYQLDEGEHLIKIEKYSGDSIDYVIPAKAIINGVEYTTQLSSRNQRGMWLGTIQHLSFEVGVLVPNDISQMFYDNQNNLKSVDLSNLDLSQITDMRALFGWDEALETVTFPDSFNASTVTNMAALFNGCQSLVDVDVSKFDTSNVTTMSNMFQMCKKIKFLDVSHFDTSKVTSMEGMFSNCESLTELDVSGFDTSKVTSMYCMFYGCDSLEELDLSNFNTENVNDCAGMLAMTGIKKLNLSGIDFSKCNIPGYIWESKGSLFGKQDLSTLEEIVTPKVSHPEADFPTTMYDKNDIFTSYSSTLPGGALTLVRPVTVTYMDKTGTETLYTVTFAKGGDVSDLHTDYKWVTEVEGHTVADLTNVQNDMTIYAPDDPASIVITANKELAGRNLEAGEFSFRIAPKDGSSLYTDAACSTAVDETTASNDALGSIHFDPIYFPEAGTYSYELKEVIPENADSNISYDRSIKSFTVAVEEENGTLTAKVMAE